MSSYVDLVITPVPAARLGDYRRLAELSAQVWREHGALSYVELEADDAKPGKVTSFPQSVALEAGETVIVAMITYRSRAHRDEVGGRAMKDPRMAGMDPKTMPFDAKRMFFGGFKPLIGDAGLVEELSVAPNKARSPAEQSLIKSDIKPGVGLRLLDYELVCSAPGADHAITVTYLT